ncbi:MAG: sodium/glutamate symporter [Lachnospiraceae bacterium]|nr:sodium/glutamate symporter [Lachnospiraceae bacterium]
MYSIVIAFGLASLMLCLGMALRGKLRFFQKTLMPVSVIGGVLGFLLVNLLLVNVNIGGVSVTDFSSIVDVFFVFSFISIGLTGGKKKSRAKTEEEKKAKKANGPVKGAMGMGLIWCILYAITPILGILIVSVVGKAFGMNAMYGILIPFAFCQGPGQASTYGKLFENTYGFANAEMVSLSFAIFGFLAAFLIGVPLAKYGLKKGLARNKNKINEAVERGYFIPEEQRETIGKSTTHSANIESIAAHFAIMGVCYLLALVLAKGISYLPVLGSTFSAMLFFWGMIAAYIVKAVMGKLKIDYLINNAFQSRLTGFLSDYLVVCAFMAIQLSVIGNWIVPILIVSVICAFVTFIVCLFFSARLGSDHDFERLLGLYGTSTGTTPSGISLLRMVDPKLQTNTGAELGMMNMAMLLSTPTMIFITFAGLKSISLTVACAGMFATILLYLVLLKVFRVWKKPTFSLIKGRIHDGSEEDEEIPFLKGFLNEASADQTVEMEKMLSGNYK